MGYEAIKGRMKGKKIVFVKPDDVLSRFEEFCTTVFRHGTEGMRPDQSGLLFYG